MIKKTTEELLEIVSDLKVDGSLDASFDGAYNIREDCKSVARRSTENIKIESKADGTGIDIIINPNTKGEKAYIPACITQSNVDDLVYNDFIVGENADVTIIAGCGVHSDTGELSRHNGIHRFFLAKGARVLYIEKHVGTGKELGDRQINPVTEIYLDEDAVIEMDTLQLGGVTCSDRKTTARMHARSKIFIRERILTDNDEIAKTHFDVDVMGEDATVSLVSRSVAKGHSYQAYYSNITGNARCSGHSECDGILVGGGKITATPSLIANTPDAALIHEAAIGKIAGEQILKLRTLGLTEEEAEAAIINGFLR